MKAYKIRKRDGVKFVLIPAIEELNLVYHAFSTRVGGVSTGTFKSMDLGLLSGGDTDLVEINRCMFVKTLGAGNPEIYTVRQVHGTEIFRVDTGTVSVEEARQVEADAIVTDQAETAIGVLTADCVPILLLDPEKKVVAAVHAGREGSRKSFVSKVIERLVEDFRSSPGAIRAAVGPCIESGCYEVGPDIALQIQQHDRYKSQVLKTEKGSHLLDLRKMNHLQLLDAGVQEERIYHVDLCTACHSRTFYSYRKSEGKPTGRMMALIMLKAQ
jgi:YfiH family protein